MHDVLVYGVGVDVDVDADADADADIERLSREGDSDMSLKAHATAWWCGGYVFLRHSKANMSDD